MNVEKTSLNQIVRSNEWILPREKLQIIAKCFNKGPANEIIDPKTLQNYYFNKLVSVCKKACKKNTKSLQTLEKVSQLVGEVRDSSGRSVLEVMIIEKTKKKDIKEFATFMNLMWGSKNALLRETLASKDYSLSLHLAAFANRPELISVLGSIMDRNQKFEGNLTPLHIAIMQGASEFVSEFLKKSGVSLELPCKLSHPKWDQMLLTLSPFALATALGKIECLNLLVEHSNEKTALCDIVQPVGNLLHLAIRCGQPLMLEHLLSGKHIETTRRLIEEKGARHDGFAPVHLAAAQGDIEALLILHLIGANLNAQDFEGRTPLHLAVINGHEEAVRLLAHPFLKVKLKKGDLEKNSPSFYAKENSDIKVFLKNAISDYEVRKKEGKQKIQQVRQSLIEQNIEQNKMLNELKEKWKELENRPPIFSKAFPPENLVLEGGGPQSIAFIGGLRVLEEQKILSEIKRLAGTSAGAITATFLAVGYTIEEAKQLLMGTVLISLMDYNNKKGKRRTFNTLPVLILKMKTFANNLSQFIRRISTLNPPTSKEFLQIAKMMGLTLLNSVEYAKIIADQVTILYDLNNRSGLCQGDALQKWIEKAIKDKTNVDHFTFGELRNKIQSGQEGRHLHIFATNMRDTPEVVHFNSEEIKWDNHVISYVTAASGTLPVIFELRTLKCKIDDALHDDNQGLFGDGGIVYNLPIEVFDKKKYVMSQSTKEDGDCPAFNKRTLALSLYTPGDEATNNPTTGFSVLGNVGNMMYNAERALRKTVDYNAHRIIKVSNLNVSTFEFDLGKEKMEELSNSSVEPVNNKVNNKLSDLNLESFETLSKKIEETEEQLNNSGLNSIEGFFEQLEKESQKIMSNFGQDIFNFFDQEEELFNRLWQEVEKKANERL